MKTENGEALFLIIRLPACDACSLALACDARLLGLPQEVMMLDASFFIHFGY
jgi:hypothetical protein